MISNVLKDRIGDFNWKKKELVQSLWSAYGSIERWTGNSDQYKSVIVKHIRFPKESKHPRGWNTVASHKRKVKSYEVEMGWYKSWAKKCNEKCKLPRLIASQSEGDEHVLVLEDLDEAGFSKRCSCLKVDEVKLGLKWLANFHATFMGELPNNLWKEGSYWHLATRPDEWEAMAEGPLKSKAQEIDQLLSNCQYKTIIHGDAKVANFCFNEDMTRIAAVDFQYVGGGCGMKDLVYFLGSCLTEMECDKYENELLDFYFEELNNALISKENTLDFEALEKEWRSMYAIAWTDFSRFLMGWMPTHQKLNNYSKKLMKKALNQI